MIIHEEKTKADILQRLKRVEGQMRGLQTMIQEERDCRQVLQQISAARSALQAATLVFLEDYASECILNIDPKNPQERQELVHELIATLQKSASLT